VTRIQQLTGGGDADTGPTRDADREGSNLGRKLAAALAVGGAAYLALRRLRSAAQSEGGLPGASSLPIGEPGTDETGEPADRDDEPIEDAPGEDRTPEEIAERVGGDVDAKPAEPGEMAIDESVVEDAVDEAELATAEEGDAATENDERDAEADDREDDDATEDNEEGTS